MKGSKEHQIMKNKFNQRLNNTEPCGNPFCDKDVPKGQGFCNQECCDKYQWYHATKDEGIQEVSEPVKYEQAELRKKYGVIGKSIKTEAFKASIKGL